RKATARAAFEPASPGCRAAVSAPAAATASPSTAVTTRAPFMQEILSRAGGRAPSIPQAVALRFRQVRAPAEAHRGDEQGDGCGGVGQPDRGRFTRHHVDELRRDKGETRTEHPAADVGGKSLACAPEVGWVDARQVIAPETELRDGEESSQEHAPFCEV